MLAMVVEGKDDYRFFAQLMEHVKSFNRGAADSHETYKTYGIAYNHFKPRHGVREAFYGNFDSVTMLVGDGKHNAKRMFVETTLTLLTSGRPGMRSLLVIDSDASQRPINAVLPTSQEIAQRAKRLKFCVDEQNDVGGSCTLNIKKGRFGMRVDLMVVEANLDQFLCGFLKDNKIVNEDLLRDDPKKSIQNVIARKNLKNFDELCRFLFLKKRTEIEGHPTLRPIIDCLCSLNRTT